ncbi:hypothetical protein ACW5EG_12595 [Luteimonas sp. A611]
MSSFKVAWGDLVGGAGAGLAAGPDARDGCGGQARGGAFAGGRHAAVGEAGANWGRRLDTLDFPKGGSRCARS